MTDSDIIKAFKNCEIESTCFECPKNIAGQGCDGVAEEILDLINRQKAESENQSQNFKKLVAEHRDLQIEFQVMRGVANDYKKKYESNNETIGQLDVLLRKEEKDYRKLLAETKTLRAEAEKLQANYSSMQSTLAKMSMGVEEARAEAIKEFAERLKENTVTVKIGNQTCKVITIDGINYLVKEKAGDAE